MWLLAVWECVTQRQKNGRPLIVLLRHPQLAHCTQAISITSVEAHGFVASFWSIFHFEEGRNLGRPRRSDCYRIIGPGYHMANSRLYNVPNSSLRICSGSQQTRVLSSYTQLSGSSHKATNRVDLKCDAGGPVVAGHWAGGWGVDIYSGVEFVRAVSFLLVSRYSMYYVHATDNTNSYNPVIPTSQFS